MIDWDKQPLGRVSDSELARRLGVTPGAVRQARARRGIAAALPVGQPSRYDWSAVALGERPDAAIAAELGCSRRTVARARKRAGVAPYKRAK